MEYIPLCNHGKRFLEFGPPVVTLANARLIHLRRVRCSSGLQFPRAILDGYGVLGRTRNTFGDYGVSWRLLCSTVQTTHLREAHVVLSFGPIRVVCEATDPANHETVDHLPSKKVTKRLYTPHSGICISAEPYGAIGKARGVGREPLNLALAERFERIIPLFVSSAESGTARKPTSRTNII